MTVPWVEVGERCWMRRYPEYDVNVGVVAGSDGVLVIDTRANVRQGQAVRADVRRLCPQPVVAVANTHAHFDHLFGNGAFVTDVGDRFFAHANVAASMRAEGDVRDEFGSPVAAPARTFADEQVIDLGDRTVLLCYLGRGHTDGDVVAVVGGGDGVVFAGDLVEESADPSFGDDCYPLDWPGTLDALASLVGEQTVVVPGHGAAVGRAFVVSQGAAVRAVAATIRALHDADASLEDALAHGCWPYPREWLADAVRRGYAALGTGCTQTNRRAYEIA